MLVVNSPPGACPLAAPFLRERMDRGKVPYAVSSLGMDGGQREPRFNEQVRGKIIAGEMDR